jgi:hypothetical protein
MFFHKSTKEKSIPKICCIKKAALFGQPLFYIFEKNNTMFKILAQINKLILPSFTKRGLDVSKAKKWQLAIIGYRYYVTARALG